MKPDASLDLLTPPAEQVPLCEILANETLQRRPTRFPNHKGEAEALVELAESLADSPDTILQTLAEKALHLCEADSAGVSIAELDGETEIFRWRGVAGRLKPFLMGTMPRDFSPCGHVTRSGTHHLMVRMIGHYGYVSQLGVPLHEALLVPFSVGGKPVGTMWIVGHTEERKFDSEDLRLLTALTRFASAAYQRTLLVENLEKQQKILATAARDAEEASRLKSIFLATMSHEIRTPLGAMLGFADLLRDTALSRAEQSNYVDILSRNGEQLSVIINDILDLSKVEAGHLTLEYLETSPEKIVTEVIALMQVKATEKGLALECVHESSTPASVATDPHRLRQILVNLVGNAIKFTTSGRVKIESFASEDPNGKKRLAFRVSDTGIGIPSNQHENVFEMFVQADGSMTRRFGGTGLGLALSRKLARALGGDVVIERSAEGQGASFLFTVRNEAKQLEGRAGKASAIEVAPRPTPEVLAGKRVLVVDDSADNRHLIGRYLIKQGVVVEWAENGVEGYEKAMKADFDLVLMDIQMPIMDGYSATSKLRGNGFRKPIIALTAHAMGEVRKKCLYVGCNDHLTKPIVSADLLAMLAKHVG